MKKETTVLKKNITKSDDMREFLKSITFVNGKAASWSSAGKTFIRNLISINDKEEALEKHICKKRFINGYKCFETTEDRKCLKSTCETPLY